MRFFILGCLLSASTAFAGQKVLVVEKMTCESCAQSIKKELSKIDGIRETSVDVSDKKVKVTFDDKVGFNESKIKERIDFLGYKVTSVSDK